MVVLVLLLSCNVGVDMGQMGDIGRAIGGKGGRLVVGRGDGAVETKVHGDSGRGIADPDSDSDSVIRVLVDFLGTLFFESVHLSINFVILSIE